MKRNNLWMIMTIISVVVSAFAFTNSSEDGSSMVIIRCVEKPSGTMGQKNALAVYVDGAITEHLELEDLSGKTLDNNLKVIGDVIAKYKKQGYQLKNSTGAGAVNSLVSTYILEK